MGRPRLLAGSGRGAVERPAGVGRGLVAATDDRWARSPSSDLPAPLRPRCSLAGRGSRCRSRRHRTRERRTGPPHAARFATPLPRAGPRGRTEGDRSGTDARLASARRPAGGGSGVRLVVRGGSDRARVRRLRPPPGRARRLRRRPGEPGPDAADGAGGRTDRGLAAAACPDPTPPGRGCWPPPCHRPCSRPWTRRVATRGPDTTTGLVATTPATARPLTRSRSGPPPSTTWSTPPSGQHSDRRGSPSVDGVRRPAAPGWLR